MLVLLGVIMTVTVNAQDYKHPYGLVNKDGMIMDSTGKHIGSITKEGVLKDAEGNKIAQVDANDNLVDDKTGKVIGHAPKNGTFTYYFKDSKETMTIGPPLNGICEVKDSKGKTVMLIHENYKHVGTCAVHCHMMSKKNEKMKMK